MWAPQTPTKMPSTANSERLTQRARRSAEGAKLWLSVLTAAILYPEPEKICGRSAGIRVKLQLEQHRLAMRLGDVLQRAGARQLEGGVVARADPAEAGLCRKE